MILAPRAARPRVLSAPCTRGLGRLAHKQGRSVQGVGGKGDGTFNMTHFASTMPLLYDPCPCRPGSEKYSRSRRLASKFPIRTRVTALTATPAAHTSGTLEFRAAGGSGSCREAVLIPPTSCSCTCGPKMSFRPARALTRRGGHCAVKGSGRLRNTVFIEYPLHIESKALSRSRA